MKREKIVTAGIGFALACLLSFGALGAMISGLSLPVEHPERLYGLWLLGAVLGAAPFSFKKGWILAVPAAVVGAGFIWKHADHFLALITRLSSLYHIAYRWGVLEFAGVEWREIPADIPLMVWGCLLAMTTAAAVVCGRRADLSVLLAMIPLGSTVVVTDTPPESPYLFASILAIALLLLTATVRLHSPHQGARLAARTALPVGLLLGLLFLANPQESYVNKSEEYLDRVVSWCRTNITAPFDRGGLGEQISVTPNASITSNLSRIGPRNTWNYTVMEVEADFSDTVYLRGQHFDSYDGTSWTATASREERFGGMPSYGRWTYTGTVTIRTLRAANVLYLPYYPTEIQTLIGGRIKNGGRQLSYGFSIRTPSNPDLVIQDAVVDPAPDLSGYTDLPSETRRWAVQYLQDHGLSQLPDAVMADTIADLVRSSALYDKNTPSMDRAYDDFARWFLEASETGYCVHFATAATVLLRAAGIPARYVTGYMLRTAEGETAAVTADQAHAWAEYYNESMGIWVIVESTPADLTEEETAPPVNQTEPPTGPQETDPTEPTDAPKPGSDIQIDVDAKPGNDAKPSVDLKPLWAALKWLLPPLCLLLAAEGQYRLRRRLRRRGGSPNGRALAKWRQIELLCRFTRQRQPGELKNLAEKAKFSQHTLTAEELNRFDAWLGIQRQQMARKPWYIRLALRYSLALW